MDLLIPIAANVIVGLLLAALFLGRRRSEGPSLTSAREALAVFQSRYPDSQGAVTLGDDGQAALIALTPAAGVGLVHRHGRRWNARMLQPGDLESVTVANEQELVLSMADFGWPYSRVRLADPDERSRWLSRLVQLDKQAGGSPDREGAHA
ncbi:MAG: hypothetical protein JSR54_02250 [Proteobacteria bacterium]|nr:hypothetical protein [Pseudomonadota bacterium]